MSRYTNSIIKKLAARFPCPYLLSSKILNTDGSQINIFYLLSYGYGAYEISTSMDLSI